MTWVEGILIVAVILLSVKLLCNQPPHTQSVNSNYKCVNVDTGETSSVRIHKQCGCPKCSNVEARAQKEAAEYFVDCADSAAAKYVPEDGCDVAYAQNEYGAPGMDFKEWVASQSVDSQVIANHASFVKDRTKNGENIVGRTYSPDMHDSYNPTPWIGLRRPERVPICNPTQVPDIDISLYREPGSNVSFRL
jgi:hypothetical protein